ncbi:hypothetical protein ACHHYP_20840 [Achlya hypogyna]|uniref:Tc1-like transposase DDE domain-containing protein n=1 Tax=Achlya hypogyna TaxID=1202772 RepID=A0A1V9Y5M4_ACHHY|nr:hypothetical protein ACHHYP_20840 [Achlya hypogyna]
MRRVLRRLGFRAWYIRTKLSNRTHGRTVILPEIYLDESFCNLHHVAPRSWLDSTRIRYGPSGKGDRGRGIFYGLSMVKAELLELARHNREPPQYACVAIARSWGHRVLFTPPYHPELQPIEIIWAVRKYTIARAPALTMAELSAKISSAFQDHVSDGTWLGAFSKVKSFEDKNLSFMEVDIVADHNDSANEGIDDDSALADALLAEDAEFLE